MAQLSEVPKPPAPPKEYIPRSLPPEQASNLQAMRELANASTRSAISRHAKVVEELDAAKQVGMAVMVAMTGGILFFLGSGADRWLLKGPGLITLLVGIGMGVVAGLDAWKKVRRKNEKQAAADVEATVEGDMKSIESMVSENENPNTGVADSASEEIATASAIPTQE